jgi:hypothetical protein
MSRDRNPNFMRKVVLALWPKLARYSYRPEKHYMRGPGPMTLSKIGEMLRDRVEDITQEPLPARSDTLSGAAADKATLCARQRSLRNAARLRPVRGRV